MSACGVGASSKTCACIVTSPDTAHCVQYSSSAFKSLTDFCYVDSDCPLGYVCGAFRGSNGGLTCLESTSCQSGIEPDFETEKLPGLLEEGTENENGKYRPWRLRYENSETRERVWEENAIHLASLNSGGFMVKKNSKSSANTACVPIRLSGDKIQSGGGSIGGVSGLTYLPRGGGFYFGYDEESLLESKAYDTCCIYMYKDDKCSSEAAKEFSGGCDVMFGEFPEDVLAFKVQGCGMMVGDVSVPSGGGRRLGGGGSVIWD